MELPIFVMKHCAQRSHFIIYLFCFIFPCIRSTFLELLWEAFWLKSLLNTHTNPPESNLWSCVMPLVTLLFSIRRGQPTGKEDRQASRLTALIFFLQWNVTGYVGCVSNWSQPGEGRCGMEYLWLLKAHHKRREMLTIRQIVLWSSVDVPSDLRTRPVV